MASRQKKHAKSASGGKSASYNTSSKLHNNVQHSQSYRDDLGPLRVGFLSGFTTQRHAFADRPLSLSAEKTTNLYRELVRFRDDLPVEPSSAIFVRSQESRVDLIRAMITGPEGTPYENGCFLFDVIAQDYPAKPPQMKFLTTGCGTVRFNPNLYACGTVCLSILGTWDGPGWAPNTSTLLQVLVSLQGLVFVPRPFFNKPGFEHLSGNGDPHVDQQSKSYNLGVRANTLKHAILPFLDACLNNDKTIHPEFHQVFQRHFNHRASAIEDQLNFWVLEDPSILSLLKRCGGCWDDWSENVARTPVASAELTLVVKAVYIYEKTVLSECAWVVTKKKTMPKALKYMKQTSWIFSNRALQFRWSLVSSPRSNINQYTKNIFLKKLQVLTEDALS